MGEWWEGMKESRNGGNRREDEREGGEISIPYPVTDMSFITHNAQFNTTQRTHNTLHTQYTACESMNTGGMFLLKYQVVCTHSINFFHHPHRDQQRSTFHNTSVHSTVSQSDPQKEEILPQSMLPYP